MGRLCATAAAVLVAGSAWAGVGLDDTFLSTTRSPYVTFQSTRYTRYTEGFAGRRAMYDRLGQFINYGTIGLQWDEIRDRYTAEKVEAGIPVNQLPATSSVLRENVFFRTLATLAIVREDYGDRHMGMTVGRNLSTTFTPLVFSQMHYGGLRVDYGSPDQDLSFVMSRGGYISVLRYSGMYGNTQGEIELSPVLVMGANWRRHLGALELGASHFRQVQTNLKSDAEALWRGDVPYPELQSPKVITVRVTDDDAEAPGGVAVYSAYIILTGLVDSLEQRVTSSAERAGPNVRLDARLRPRISGRRVGSHYQAEGADEAVDITFELPADMSGLEADIGVVVDGDYRIAVRQLHDFRLPGTTAVEERSWPSPPPITGTAGVYFKDRPYEAEPFYTVLRAEGQPVTDGQPREVRFKHGIPTAQSFWGANLQLTTERLSLVGEFVLNPQDFKFPTAEGKRRTETARAGYLTAQVRLGSKGSIGAEVFRMEPTYGGGYDSHRGGLILFTDVGGDVRSRENLGREALTQEFYLYDDNDDHDNWADDLPFGGDALYIPAGAYNRPTFPSSRPEGGVYPGYDLNGDLILDFDRNRNGVMDWLEPFLGYDTDPPEFVYGIDFNNNLVPDYRENDDHADYPYRRDQEGTHLFYDLTKRPWWLSMLRLGWYSSEEIAGGNASKALYARAHASLEAPSMWLAASDDLKRVEDDIPDDVYRLVLTMDRNTSLRWNQPGSLPPRDFLPMRNSVVNTAHVESGWLPLEGLVVENSLKYMLNRHLEEEDAAGDFTQESETLHNLSMVNKVSYRRQLTRQLSLTGRAKHLLARWDEGSYTPTDSVEVGQEASWSFLAPELLVTYVLTPKTQIQFGQHGFFVPFLRARYHDRLEEARSYQANVSILQVTMRGEHFGYNLATSLGLRRERRYFDAAAGRDDQELSAFYVDLIFGPE